MAKIELECRLVDGGHFISGAAVPGLCAAHTDLKTAIDEAFHQAAMIMGDRMKGMSCYVKNWGVWLETEER
jgi:hypothetical protein